MDIVAQPPGKRLQSLTLLSGGELARVHCARVLMQDTPILLLDEPTAALDLRHAESMLRVIGARARAGATVVVVLHDLAAAAAHADDVIVLPEKREEIPAVTHVDGTARLQTIHRETNPRFHQLLKEFEKVSGVPVLLNTSFNVMGEPIVESPMDAIRCFYTTGLDHLVLGNYVVSKNNSG